MEEEREKALYINDKWRIRKIDNLNLVAEQLKTIKGKNGDREGWVFAGYSSNLASALSGVYRKILFDSVEEEMQLKDVIKVVKQAEKDIMDAVKIQSVELPSVWDADDPSPENKGTMTWAEIPLDKIDELKI